MSSAEADEPIPYRLTPHALADLDDIWRYTAEKWSLAQADRILDELTRLFETITGMPPLAHQRDEFTPPVRIHPHESHRIV